ncbi:MAG: hypothetical protein GYA24_09435 [Candidatus Lokiarchaeota archaeon]|nr:hypothetical protein [Candidatus Lokiarchaeota archaeon]
MNDKELSLECTTDRGANICTVESLIEKQYRVALSIVKFDTAQLDLLAHWKTFQAWPGEQSKDAMGAFFQFKSTGKEPQSGDIDPKVIQFIRSFRKHIEKHVADYYVFLKQIIRCPEKTTYYVVINESEAILTTLVISFGKLVSILGRSRRGLKAILPLIPPDANLISFDRRNEATVVDCIPLSSGSN